MSVKNRRFEIIGEAVAGKHVLDVGCVDHRAARAERSVWLHRFICEQAKSVVGLDNAAAEAETLNRQGYDIRVGNVETVDLNERFECVIAGEIIEHLFNPGKFLINMHRHLQPGGTLILTTPNPFYPKRLIEIVFRRKPVVHPQHTAWFCPSTLSYIVRQNGFEEVKVTPFSNSESFFGIGGWPGRWRPWLSTNILLEARRPVRSN